MNNLNIGTDINYAIELLKKGEVIGIPTETVYGLAANALDTNAIKKIFLLKQRPFSNPLILHTHSLTEIKKYVTHIPLEIEKLIIHFCPAPLTFLLPKQKNVPNLITANSNLVAIRIPNHKLLLNLLQKINIPLAAPSANKFGYISPTTAQDVNYTLQNQIPYILDGGKCNIGIESTIIEFKNNKLIIHREGFITSTDIKQITNIEIEYSTNLDSITSGKNKSHYSPNTKFILGDISKLLTQTKEINIGVISYNKSYKSLFPDKIKKEIILSKNNNLDEAAHNLYNSLLELDKEKLNCIFGELFINEGIGKALNDRLQRAAFKNQ